MFTISNPCCHSSSLASEVPPPNQIEHNIYHATQRIHQCDLRL